VENHFCVEIYAPDGLSGIEAPLDSCAMPLYAYVSGYNGKVILRQRLHDSCMCWEMDSSDEDIMFASGSTFGTASDAEVKLRSLSECLTRAGFPHQILMDDCEGLLTTRIDCSILDGLIHPEQAAHGLAEVEVGC